MPIRQIIEHTDDTDLYKLTMGQGALELFPRHKVRSRFFIRSDHKFPTEFGAELRRQVQGMGKIGPSPNCKEFLNDVCGTFLKPSFVNFFHNYRYNPDEVGIIQQGDQLQIDIEGYWYSQIHWEVSLMATISELYFIMTGQEPVVRSARRATNFEKGKFYRNHNMKVADFGTRRRYSKENQHEVLVDYMDTDFTNTFLIGTSNVMFAKDLGLKPIGTMAHEWYSFHAAMYGYKMANKMALENWTKVYQGHLGIALPDTFTDEVFLRSFDVLNAKLWDGARHDSGPENEFTERMVRHYLSLGIDPTTKHYVYSNGFSNYEDAYAVHQANRKFNVDGTEYNLRNTAFGIGTYTTNDVGVEPLKIVIKLIGAQIYPHLSGEEAWADCIKLSNSASKHTGAVAEVELAKATLGL